ALAPTALPFAQGVIATVAISFQPFKNGSHGSLEDPRHGGNRISGTDRVHGCSAFLISSFQCGTNGLRFAVVFLSHAPIMPETLARVTTPCASIVIVTGSGLCNSLVHPRMLYVATKRCARKVNREFATAVSGDRPRVGWVASGVNKSWSSRSLAGARL